MANYCNSRNRATGYSLRHLKMIADNYSYCTRLYFDGKLWRVFLYDNYFKSPYPRFLWSGPVKSKEYVQRLFNF